MRVLRRRDFGPWGLGLSEADFACALAGAGICASTSDRWPPFSAQDVNDRLTAEIRRREGVVSWVRPSDPSRLAHPNEAAANLFVDVYKTVAILSPARPRFQIQLTPAEAPWIVGQLAHPSVRAGSVYIPDNSVSGDLHWSWPLKIGLLSDPASQTLFHELSEFRDHQTLSTIVTIPAPGVDADVLLVPSDLKTALLQVLSSPLPIRTSAIIVLGGFGAWEDSSAALLGALRAHVRASAATVLQVQPTRRRGWFDALMTELSHNHPFDVALLRARDEGEQAPFLVASERFVKTAALPTAIQTLLHDLSLADRAQTVHVNEEVLSRLGIQGKAKSGHESFIGGRVTAVLGELQDAVKAMLPNAHFLAESAEATTLADLSRDTHRTLQKSARPPRRIQAQVYNVADLRKPKLVQSLQVETSYQVDVRIGPSDANWVNLPDPFPDEKLPADGKVHELTIVFVEPTLAPEPQVARLLLPDVGSTEVVAFYLSTNAQNTDIQARITILHQNRVLQTALLTAPVSLKGAESKGPIVLTPEVVVSPDLSNLDGRLPFDVALVCNHTNGTPQITACADDFASLITMEDPVKFVVDLGKQFSAVANRNADQVDPKDREALFENIAARGASLFQSILRGAGGVDVRNRLKDARRWQIVTAKEGELVPLELAYTFPAPELGAKLCEEGFKVVGSMSESAAAGKVVCPAGCESGGGEKICILGFLGVTSVIERQSYSLRALAGTGANFGFRVGARPGESLDIFRKAQFAAVTRASAVVANATKPVLDTLRAVFGNEVNVVDSWAGWKQGVSSHPSLLVLIVHKDKQNDRHIIEIGDGQFAAVTQIKESYVDPDNSTHPVVLLVGCSTNVSEAEFQNLPIQFEDNGAALVVGTIATILGRDAGPVTAELIRTMAELSDIPNMAMGDALLRTKQKMVGEGKLMALCLSSYGDSGWLLCAPEKKSNVKN